MRCKNCGAEIPSTAQRCLRCGSPVSRRPLVNNIPELGNTNFNLTGPSDPSAGSSGLDATTATTSLGDTNDFERDYSGLTTMTASDVASGFTGFFEPVDGEVDDEGVYFVPKDEVVGNVPQPRRWAEAQRPKRHKIIPALVVAVGLICLGVAAYLFLIKPALEGRDTGSASAAASQDAGSKSVTPGISDAEVQRFAVSPLTLSVPELDANGSRVPMLVLGTLEDGTSFCEVQYVEADGSGLSLPAGSFTVRVAATPVAANGAVYFIPDFYVSLDVTSAEHASVSDNQRAFELSMRESDAVNDDLIQNAWSFIKADPQRANRADELAQAARDRYLNVAEEQQEANEPVDEGQAANVETTYVEPTYTQQQYNADSEY